MKNSAGASRYLDIAALHQHQDVILNMRHLQKNVHERIPTMTIIKVW